MTIHIYGDSFAAEYDKEGTWPYDLCQMLNEKMINHAKAGTGPNYSLCKLLEHLEKNEIKDYDKIIILLSDAKRLQFPFTDNFYSGIFRYGESTSMPQHAEATLKDQCLKNIETMGDDPYYNFYNHAETMKIMAQSLGPMFLYENVKNVLFLKFLSIHYPKVRFVVFTVFTLNNCIQHYENFNVKSLELLKKMNFDVLTENNFDFIKTPVISAAGMKGGDPGIKNTSNHMRLEENQKFAEMVYKIINYEEYDTDWFADDAYIDGVEVDRALPDGTIMDKDEKFFLYE